MGLVVRWRMLEGEIDRTEFVVICRSSMVEIHANELFQNVSSKEESHVVNTSYFVIPTCIATTCALG